MNIRICKFIVLFFGFFINFSAYSYKFENRCSFVAEDNSIESGSYVIWDPNKGEFPVSLCVDWDDFSYMEARQIQEGVSIWNKAYKDYKVRRWGNQHDIIGGIPDNYLFNFDCDQRRHVLVLKRYIINDRELAYTQSGWFFGAFVRVTMGMELNSSRNRSEGSLFIEVFMHELGHVLGIPHLRNDKLMYPSMRECNKYQNICRPIDSTLKAFLAVYSPYVSQSKIRVKEARANVISAGSNASCEDLRLSGYGFCEPGAVHGILN